MHAHAVTASRPPRASTTAATSVALTWSITLALALQSSMDMVWLKFTAAINCVQEAALQEKTQLQPSMQTFYRLKFVRVGQHHQVPSCETGTPLLSGGDPPVAQCTQCSGEQEGSCRCGDVQPLAQNLTTL